MRNRRLLSILGLLWLVLAALAPRLMAEEASKGTSDEPKYIRIKRDDAGEPIALQTSVVHFVPRDGKPGPTVDLIGAVHVGEKDYYEALNKLFETYDVVLYELVAPEGTRVPKGGRSSGHPVALLQNGMKDMLGLEHQMQHVDYTKENLVHADMSPDDFSKSMQEKGESWGTMFFRMMGAGIAQQARLQAQGKSSDLDFLSAFLSNDRAGSMKRMLAEQFEDAENMMQALEGPNGSTIIAARNQVALDKLKEQIAKGKKKIAIFYGAGHLKDMEQRLVDQFQLKRGDEGWMSAWNLAPAKKEAVKP